MRGFPTRHMKIKKRSAGIVVTRRIEGEIRYLLLRCYAYWDFPKGELGPGEDPLDTAKREVTEETGLTGLELRWGEVFSETSPYGRGKVARYFVARSTTGDVILPISPELGMPEHHEYRWVSFEEAGSLLNKRVRSILEWAQETICR